jgi:YesN/AraC family two-component response regulator
MNLHILFVDDELNVLQGLQRMLRVMRHEWNMAFAQSGQEALDILSKESFDVVVSDMRMPGMDGAQLLNEVMKRYPQIVRIVLSGQSDREMVLKSVRPAHQYLSKP